jgi:hypothetical protein
LNDHAAVLPRGEHIEYAIEDAVDTHAAPRAAFAIVFGRGAGFPGVGGINAFV